MRKKQLEGRKYQSTNRPSPVMHDVNERQSTYDRRSIPEEIQQQLRVALEELEHHRLNSDLEIQKRYLLEQQLKTLRHDYEEHQQEKQQLKRQLARISKKYCKVKEKKGCEKCKEKQEENDKIEKERQIYLNDRRMLQEEIKTLKNQLDNSQTIHQREKLMMLADSLKKQLYFSSKKIQQQAKIIQYMNEKLSLFELQNVQIMNNLELLENKLSQVEIEKVIRKKYCSNCNPKSKPKPEDIQSDHSVGRKRKNGSINNMKRAERDEGYADQLERYES